MKPSLLLFASLIFILHGALAQNKKPTLSGPWDYITQCSEICITIHTNDQDPADSTFIYWANDIPAAQWSDNNGTVKHAAGYFCWTPTEEDASTLPYHFWACVTDKKDTTCSKYTITVLPHPQATRSFVNKGNGLWQLTIAPNPNSSFFNEATFKWYKPKFIGTGSPIDIFSQQASITYQFTSGGGYIIKSSIYWKGCTQVYFDTLQVDSSFAAPTGITQNNISAKIAYMSANMMKVSGQGMMHASIFGINGKQQMTYEGENELFINLSSLCSGIYLMKLEQGGYVGGYQIIRQ
jgi:hypothetical protein